MLFVIKAFITLRGIVGSTIGSQGNCPSLKSCQSLLNHSELQVVQSQTSSQFEYQLQIESIPIKLIGFSSSYQVPSGQDSQEQSNQAYYTYSRQVPSQAYQQLYLQAFPYSSYLLSNGLDSSSPFYSIQSLFKDTLSQSQYYPLSFSSQVHRGLPRPVELQQRTQLSYQGQGYSIF